jgi:hypothetical protein
MQASPPTGSTGRAPPLPPPPGDGGTDVTLDEALIARGSSAPETPNPIATRKAAPPHTAPAVLPLRFVTIPNCSL